jgi:hypothetical protein
MVINPVIAKGLSGVTVEFSLQELIVIAGLVERLQSINLAGPDSPARPKFHLPSEFKEELGVVRILMSDTAVMLSKIAKDVLSIDAAHKSLFDPSVGTESRKEVNNEL